MLEPTGTCRLVVDGHAIAELRCEAYVEGGPIPKLAGRLLNVVEYEKDARVWQKLWSRAWLVPDSDRLADYLKYLQGRGKAAILERGGDMNAITCLIPPRRPRSVDSACLCLFSQLAKKEHIRLLVQGECIGEVCAPISTDFFVAADGWRDGSRETMKDKIKNDEYALCVASDPKFHAFAMSLHQADKSAALTSELYPIGAIVTATMSPQQIEIWLPRSILDTSVVVEKPIVTEKAADDTTAANFYNQLDRRWGSQTDSQIYHLRRFNNWVKSELIKKGTELCRMRQEEPINVLDLACGKGGDLSKWGRVGPLAAYAGLDIAESSLEDLRTRLRDARNLQGLEETRIVAANLGKRSLLDAGNWRVLDLDSGLWSVTTQRPLNRRYDIASIQFALHYVFQQESKAITFFKDVAALLRPNGVFVATTVDARALCALMLTRGEKIQGHGPNPMSASSTWWRADVEDELIEAATEGLEPLRLPRKEKPRVPLTVWMEDNIIDRLISRDPSQTVSSQENMFGLRYWFQLRDSAHAEAVDSPEWLAPPELLTQLGHTSGLVLESRQNFADFLAQRQAEDPQGTLRSLRTYNVPDRLGSLSPADWDILRLYTTLVFRRRPNELEMAQAFSRAKKSLGHLWNQLDRKEQNVAVTASASDRNITIKTEENTGRYYVAIV